MCGAPSSDKYESAVACSKKVLLLELLFCGVPLKLTKDPFSLYYVPAILKLPRKDRRAYETAVEVFPQLVRRETKIISFLRREDFDVEKAAVRLTLYWIP